MNSYARNTKHIDAKTNPNARYTAPRNVNKLKNPDTICAHTKIKCEPANEQIRV